MSNLSTELFEVLALLVVFLPMFRRIEENCFTWGNEWVVVIHSEDGLPICNCSLLFRSSLIFWHRSHSLAHIDWDLYIVENVENNILDLNGILRGQHFWRSSSSKVIIYDVWDRFVLDIGNKT